MTLLVEASAARSISTDAPEPIDPQLLRTVALGLTLAEMEVALHASGHELPRTLHKNLPMVLSLVESGLARIGLVAVQEQAAKMLAYGGLVIAAVKLGLKEEADAAADSYEAICGGRVRSSRCQSLAYHLYCGPRLAVLRTAP